MARTAVALGVLVAGCAGGVNQAGASTFDATTIAGSPNGALVYAGFDGLGFSVFSRDPNTGMLTLLSDAAGQSSGGGLFNSTLAPSPDGTSVYGVDGQSDTLTQYAASGNGVTAQSAYPVLANPEIAKDPNGVTVSPDGTSVYVTTYGYGPPGVGVSSRSAITAFERNSSTGTLTQGATVQSGELGGISTPVVSPDGQFVYAGDAGGVDVFGRDPATGALTSVGTEGSLPGVTGLAISPDGATVYATGPSGSSSSSGTLTVFSRNPSSGQLNESQQITNGSGGVTDLSDMWGLAVSPDGQCVYATSRADGSIASFTRDTTTGDLAFAGVLTEGTDGGLGLAGARQVAVSPDSRSVYVASPADNGVGVFERSSSGCALTFEQFVQDVFMVGAPSVDSAQGTATVPVVPQTTGSVQLTTKSSDGSVASSSPESIPSDQTTDVAVPLDADQQATLSRQGSLDVDVNVDFTATGGVPTSKATTLTLVKSSVSGSASELRRALRRIPVLRGHSARVIDVLRAKGARVHFSAPEAGHLAIEWVLRTTRRIKRHGHRHREVISTVLARGTAVYRAAGRSQIKITLTRQGHRELVSTKHQLRLLQVASFAPKAGNSVTVTRSFRLAAPPRKKRHC